MNKTLRNACVVLGLGVCGIVALKSIAVRHQPTTYNTPTMLQVPAQLPIDEPKIALPDPGENASKAVFVDEQPPVAVVTMPNDQPPASLPPLPPSNVPPPASVVVHDPDKAAEEFVERTRKEAASAVETLGAEAAQLRERLAKVEAGLAKYRETLSAVCPKAVAADLPAKNEEPQLSPAVESKDLPKDVDVLDVPKSPVGSVEKDLPMELPPRAELPKS